MTPMVSRIVADAEAAGLHVERDGTTVVVRRDALRAVRLFSNGTALRIGVELTAARGMRSEREIRRSIRLPR